MRHILGILAWPAGIMTVFSMAAAFLKGGSDLQLISTGIFFGVMVTALGFVGVMARLEEIRDRSQK